jgi:hypothetical protein
MFSRLPDRFWWVQRVGGALLVLGGLIGAISAVILGLDLSQLTSDSPVVSQVWHLETQKTFLQAGEFALLTIIGIFDIRESFPAHERVLRRRRALEGEQEAMRRANVKVDRRHAPDLVDGSLELLGRATPLNGRIMTTIIAIIVVIFGPLALLFWYLAYCTATNTPPIGSTYLEPMSPLERVGVVAVTLGVGAGLAFLVGFVIWILPWEWGRPVGVVADDEGLWDYPKGGRKRFLRWDEVRLLEVTGRLYHQYKLYGQESVATWSDGPLSSLVTYGLTKQEFGERHQALLDLIAARTGLVPRMLDKKLVEVGSGVGGWRGFAEKRPGSGDGDEPDRKHGDDEGAQGVAGRMRGSVEGLEDEDGAEE